MVPLESASLPPRDSERPLLAEFGGVASPRGRGCSPGIATPYTSPHPKRRFIPTPVEGLVIIHCGVREPSLVRVLVLSVGSGEGVPSRVASSTSAATAVYLWTYPDLPPSRTHCQNLVALEHAESL